MKKRTKRIINSALCLTTVSAMLLGNGNNFVLSHAEDVYVEVEGHLQFIRLGITL